MARLLSDPLLPTERVAAESGLYLPPLVPGDPPEEAGRIVLGPDGEVRLPSFLLGFEVLGSFYAAAVRGFNPDGEFASICARQNTEPSRFRHTVAWAAQHVSSDPTRIPARAAFEMFVHGTARWLERWAERMVALLEEVVEEPEYSLVPADPGSRRPERAYSGGRGRRVSVTSPTDVGFSEFVSVADVYGEGDGEGDVRREQLRETTTPAVCPGSRIDPGHARSVNIILGRVDDAGGDGAETGRPRRFSFAAGRGLVRKLPLCLTAHYRDGGVPVPLKDLPRLRLASLLGAIRQLAGLEQYRVTSAALAADIRPQGREQQHRMGEVLARRRAPRPRHTCSSCPLSTWGTCYDYLYDGAGSGAPRTPPSEASTVADLLVEVRKANIERQDRQERAAALKDAAAARRAASCDSAAPGPKKPRHATSL